MRLPGLMSGCRGPSPRSSRRCWAALPHRWSASADMVRSGPRSCRRPRAADGMATAAAGRKEEVCAALLGQASLTAGWRWLCRARLEMRRLQRDDVKAHQRVRPAAIFGALSPENPSSRRRNRIRLTVPANHIDFTGQAGAQKLWMTSAEERMILACRPVGIRISLAVTASGALPAAR